MKPTILMTGSLILALAPLAEARRGGGGGNRPETITCAMYQAGSPQPQAPSSALVQNGEALLKGDAAGYSYILSVRGKTAVLKLQSADSGQILTTKGAIELLRHGGEVRPAPAALRPLRRGEDDAQDGQPEREAGIEMNIADASAPNRALVSVKCESKNTPVPAGGVLQ